MRTRLLTVLVAAVIVGGTLGAIALMSIWPVQGAAQKFNIGPEGGNITAFGGSVEVFVPSGALEAQRTITVDRANPSEGHFYPGTAYVFGPEGTTFAKPVQIRIAYDPTGMPSGYTEEELRLAKRVELGWRVFAASGVNETDNVVGGMVDSFSTYAVVADDTPRVAIIASSHVARNETIPISVDYNMQIPECTISYKERWTEPPNRCGRFLVRDSEDLEGGVYGDVAEVQYLGLQPIGDEQAFFSSWADGDLGATASITVDVYACFDADYEDGRYYHWGHASCTVTLS